MEQGTVKWFNPHKGLGVICIDRSGEDVVVHASSVAPDSSPLSEGQSVSFERVQRQNGIVARSVRPL